ncbi:MAG: hypothetical protein HY038_11190 [Nitrospirae bacterium]|nr:hypothetical protein [Nitrospirota bacterium]
MHIHDPIALRAAIVAFIVMAASIVVMPSASAHAQEVSPALLSEVVAHQAGQLARIDSDADAMVLFTTSVGLSLGLKDVAGALGANGLPAKLAKELGITELTQSVHQLMAALAAWQLADLINHAGENTPSSTTAPVVPPPAAQQDWMTAGSHLSTLADFFRLLAEQRPSDPAQPVTQAQRAELLLAAHRVAFEAHQRATVSWWELHEWKDRVRQARGQARLCGTWQWVIHNHQNHREQKTVVLFPPAGQVPANSPLPAETVVLGDSIYLRWEQEGRVQEDSLLFVKDGTRIEGSFVNNTGGWGSITGKRTAGCQP